MEVVELKRGMEKMGGNGAEEVWDDLTVVIVAMGRGEGGAGNITSINAIVDEASPYCESERAEVSVILWIESSDMAS